MARVRVWYAVGVVVLVTAYFALPAARPVLAAVIGLVTVGAIEYGVRRLSPQRAGAWRCLAAALAVLAIGDTIFNVLEARSPEPVPFPALPDVFYLATYIVLTMALFWLGRPNPPYRDETTLIDAVSVTLAGSLIIWLALVRPAIEDQPLAVAGRATAIAAWVGYVAVLAASVRVVLCWRRNTAVGLLGVAMLAFLISEINQVLQGTWIAGTAVDLGYFAFSTLCGLAALTPSMRDVASPAHTRHTLGPGRLAVIAVVMLVAPTALLVEASTGAYDAWVAIATVSALVSVLMLFRLAMTGRAYQRRAAREHAARIASQAMVVAATPEDVVAGTRSAVQRVAFGRGPVTVELVRPYRRGPAAPVVPTPVRRDSAGELVVPLSGSDAALGFAGPIDQIVDLRDLLVSLADQAALAMLRIDLAETAGAEERERYFRTLVTTSTDVILICRDGRIEYATPSADAMFGREVIGERFDDLVHPDTDVEHPLPAVAPGEGGRAWPDTVDGAEGTIRRPDGEVSREPPSAASNVSTVLVHRRDLTDDPTVRGVVTTLRDITAEHAMRRDLDHRANHDELTGLANGRLFDRTLGEERERRVSRGEGTAVLFVDLDDFKAVNDGYGHEAGDEVLAEVGRRIRTAIRAEDLAARVGGDEFAIVLREVPSVDDARAVAQRVAEALSRPAYVGGDPVDCSGSVGLAYTDQRERVEFLMGEADAALYVAKADGRGLWREYVPGMPDRRPIRRRRAAEVGR